MSLILYISLGILFAAVLLAHIFKYVKNFRKRKLEAKFKKQDRIVKRYLETFSKDDKIEILDKTPRYAQVGGRTYLLEPLVYRQFLRLCVMVGHTLEKLYSMGISVENVDKNIGKALEASEDEFFKCIAAVLYFSKKRKEDDVVDSVMGIEDEFNYLKEHATLEEVTRIVEIIARQNDIKRALKAFGALNLKKKESSPNQI